MTQHGVPARRPAGTPVGGQFAPSTSPETLLELTEAPSAGGLSQADIEAGTHDPRWLGFGYLGARKLAVDKVTLAASDAVVIRLANEHGLSSDELFHWMNSVEGRLYGEMAADHDPKQLRWRDTAGDEHDDENPQQSLERFIEHRARSWGVMDNREDFIPSRELLAQQAAEQRLELKDDDLFDDLESPPLTPPQHERAIDLHAKLAEQLRGPVSGRPVFGRRGFTLPIAGRLQPFTGSGCVPGSYREKISYLKEEPGGPDEFYANGDMGIFYYAGAGADAARELLRLLPAKNLTSQQNTAPAVRTVLKAAVEHPEEVAFGGYIVGPDRSDERVSVDAIYLHASDATEEQVRARVRQLLGNRSKPDEVNLVDAPGQPGVKAWRCWWD